MPCLTAVIILRLVSVYASTSRNSNNLAFKSPYHWKILFFITNRLYVQPFLFFLTQKVEKWQGCYWEL